jgi:hypothetical protein
MLASNLPGSRVPYPATPLDLLFPSVLSQDICSPPAYPATKSLPGNFPGPALYDIRSPPAYPATKSLPGNFPGPALYDVCSPPAYPATKSLPGNFPGPALTIYARLQPTRQPSPYLPTRQLPWTCSFPTYFSHDNMLALQPTYPAPTLESKPTWQLQPTQQPDLPGNYSSTTRHLDLPGNYSWLNYPASRPA